MPPRRPVVPARPERAPVARRTPVLVTALALALGVLAPLTALAPGAAAADNGTPVPADLTLTQANIKSALSVENFQADVARVLAPRPELVTYNEVPFRVDTVLAPSGYAVHRSTKNRYTKATAVAWRTDRWTLQDAGTFRISNYREKPPGRSIKLGLRFANWVTLVSPEGRTVSVVAAHIAPLDKNMPDLLRTSVTRLGKLARKLAPHGPVLMGGDFNVHYRSGRYPRDLFDASALVPVYDTLGTYYPTGDHGGSTIDFVFNRGADLLEATSLSTLELKSDHDAVQTGFDWTVDAPGQTQGVISRPVQEKGERTVAEQTVLDLVRDAKAGQRIDVATSELRLASLRRVLLRAMARGVRVHVTTRSVDLSFQERRVARRAERSGEPGNALVQCLDECRATWRDAGLTRTTLLLSDTAGSPSRLVEVNRAAGDAMRLKRAKVVTSTGPVALDEAASALARVR